VAPWPDVWLQWQWRHLTACDKSDCQFISSVVEHAYIDDHVREMFGNFLKYQAFTGPIELNVKFLRSTYEILELCQTPTYDNFM
jgi:hypothetical protein